MSISFYAGKYTDPKTVDWVFTREEITSRFYDGVADMEGKDNPAYRPELNVNMSNDNAAMVLMALGIVVEDGCFETKVDEFINRCTNYLKKNVGKKSPAVPASVTKNHGGPTFINMGVDEGYIERQVHRIVVLAREGKARGAEVIYGA